MQRRLRLKCRDGGASAVLLVVADTRSNRRVLRAFADELAEQFPLTSREVLAAFRAAQLPARSGIVVL